MIDAILDYWPILAAFIGFVVWLVRMEAIALSNKREIARLWKQRKEDMDAAHEDRAATNRKIDRLSDDVKALSETLTADVKQILARMPR